MWESRTLKFHNVLQIKTIMQQHSTTPFSSVVCNNHPIQRINIQCNMPFDNFELYTTLNKVKFIFKIPKLKVTRQLQTFTFYESSSIAFKSEMSHSCDPWLRIRSIWFSYLWKSLIINYYKWLWSPNFFNVTAAICFHDFNVYPLVNVACIVRIDTPNFKFWLLHYYFVWYYFLLGNKKLGRGCACAVSVKQWIRTWISQRVTPRGCYGASILNRVAKLLKNR